MLKHGAKREPETVGDDRREALSVDFAEDGGLDVEDTGNGERHHRHGEDEAQPEIVAEGAQVDEHAALLWLLHHQDRRTVPKRKGKVHHLLADAGYCKLCKSKVCFL